jgi:hypothetical protein
VDNPFESLMDQAYAVVFDSLRRFDNTSDSPDMPGDLVFSFIGNEEGIEFNLRLGKALLACAEAAKNATWAGIGRSLILSALSSGKSDPIFSETETNEENSAKLYRILSPVDMYPRALVISTSNNIWAWTAAQLVSASQRNDELDISVTFPAGETHYLIIRGIRPFARIQIHSTDIRANSQFERNDSSGWNYVSQEQCLIVKMRHRTNLEHIRIIYREEPVPEPVITNNTATVATENTAAEETFNY